MKKLILPLFVALSCSAHAEITFNGFATVAGGMTFENDTEYHGMNDSLSFSDLSLFGLQVSADLGEDLTATAQILSRGSNNFDAEFEWAYVSYQFNDKLNFKAGRLRLPTYYYSEFLDVSFAYHWLTPPQEMYAAIITNYDGISAYYADTMGDVDYSIQVGSGKRSDFFEGFGNFEADYKLITNIDFTYDVWSTKLVYMIANNALEDMDLSQLQALFTEPKYANALSVDDNDYYIAGLASYLNLGPVLLGVEYTEIKYDDIEFVLNSDERLLVTAAYSFDKYTVHYSYSSSQQVSDATMLGGSDPRYATLKGLGIVTGADIKTHTLGVKYDFHPSASLKLDVGTTDDDYIDTDTGFARTGIVLVF